MAINTVIHTGEQSIGRVLQAGRPVVLVFWKPGAGANGAFHRTLDRLAEQYAGKVLIAKVDAAAEPTLVQHYHIRSVPSLVFVKNGKADATATGALGEKELTAWLTYLAEGGARPAHASGPSVPLQGSPRGNGVDQAPRTQSHSAGTGANGAGVPVTLTDANFQHSINSADIVLVDFWAPWCGPCRMVAPAVEQLAREFQGKAVIGKLNVDENPRTAQQYNIMGIPALYIFKHGAVVDQIVGVQPVDVLRHHLMRYMTH